MARFTGSGTLTISGTDARIYDCQMDVPLSIAGSAVRIEGNRFNDRVTLEDGAQSVLIRGNVVNDEIHLEGNNDHAVIVGNYLNPQAGSG